ncbi:MAG: hypothetical protein ACKVK6_16240, partial [bacterium]
MGGQNLLFFRNLMTAVFDNVTEVDETFFNVEKNVENNTAENLENFAGLDGILIPEVIKYGFLTPNVSGLKFFSASIHYRMSLYNVD